MTGQTVPLGSVGRVLVEQCGWQDRRADVLAAAVAARAEALGMTVVPGWGGEPSLSAGDADGLVVIAAGDQRAQIERDAEDARQAGEAAVRDAGAVSVGEVAGMLGESGITTATRADGGAGLPGVIGFIDAPGRPDSELAARRFRPDRGPVG